MSNKDINAPNITMPIWNNPKRKHYTFLKPLVRYRKFLLSEKLLKILESKSMMIQGSPEVQFLMKGYHLYFIRLFFEEYPKYKVNRVMEAIDILAKNKHINTYPDADLLKYMIMITDEGERALNDGVYTERAYKVVWKVIGASVALISAIIATIKWIIPLLKRA